jgi:hypothetical protein
MKVEIARMHAHVCGDGDIGIYTEKRGKRDIARYNRKNIFMKSYRVRYTNNKTNLLEEFKEDARNAFDASGSIRKNECRVKNKKVFTTLKNMGAGSSKSWHIPEEVFRSKKVVRAEWLRAFCDDESTVDLENKRIRIKSVNFDGLNQVKSLFETVNINARITGPNIDKTWYLTIPRPEIPKLAKIIELKHQERQMKIMQLLE